MSRATPKPFPEPYPPELPFGCVLFYDFNNMSEKKVIDNSGLGNHGKIFGCNKKSQNYGASIYMDGIDDYINIPNPSPHLTNLATNFSIIACINLPTLPIATRVIYGGSENVDSNTKDSLCIQSSGKIGFDQFQPSGGLLTSNTVLNTNRNYMVAYTQKSNYRAILVDGKIDNSDNSPETFSGTIPSTWDVGKRIQKTGVGGNVFTNMIIGFLMIFNRYVPPLEVKDIMSDHAWKYGVKI